LIARGAIVVPALCAIAQVPIRRVLPNAELKVAVINFEDASGQKAIAVGRDSLDLKRKVQAAPAITAGRF
jgi:hypothetical protein